MPEKRKSETPCNQRCKMSEKEKCLKSKIRSNEVYLVYLFLDKISWLEKGKHCFILRCHQLPRRPSIQFSTLNSPDPT